MAGRRLDLDERSSPEITEIGINRTDEGNARRRASRVPGQRPSTTPMTAKIETVMPAAINPAFTAGVLVANFMMHLCLF